MSVNQRIFVDAIRRYCRAHGITCEVKSEGWLIIMRSGEHRHLAFGYDIGLNSAMAHRIANDKSATAEVLAHSAIACIPHTMFLSPKLGKYASAEGAREAMVELLRAHTRGLVAKPNEGTSGRFVFKVTSEAELDNATGEIFAKVHQAGGLDGRVEGPADALLADNLIKDSSAEFRADKSRGSLGAATK